METSKKVCGFGFTNKIRFLENLLGIDIWIEKDTFKYTSYAMVEVTLKRKNSIEKVILDSHRLHEGLNILRFKISKVTENDFFEKVILDFHSQKPMTGKFILDSLYLI